MAETQVLGFGTAGAPNSRTTRGTERFQLLAVDATFDGTAAAGSFVPAVQIISDAGQEVGTFPLQSTLSVGDTATVTFAPFLRSTSGGGGLVLQSAQYSGNNVNLIPGGIGTLTWDSFDTGDDLLDLSVPAAPTVRTAGLYIVNGVFSCRTGGISFRNTMNIDVLGSGASAAAMTGDISALGGTGFVSITIAYNLAAGAQLFADALNQGGFAANFYLNEANVSRIASS